MPHLPQVFPISIPGQGPCPAAGHQPECPAEGCGMVLATWLGFVLPTSLEMGSGGGGALGSRGVLMG